MNWIVDIILQGLNFFYTYTGNYGLSIIFLTIIINIALYPLTLSSIVQMAAMQKIQPKLQAIQKKHKDNPQELQKELSELYKSEKVNPFGGCLPMLLKIPFFIGFFMALQDPKFTALIANQKINSAFLWMSNLSKPDHLYIMIALIALTTYFAQKTMPGSANNTQMASMNYIMPFFIAFISVGFPAGVQLYWVVSNSLSIAQQWYIGKYLLNKEGNL
ncbi:membrane protein insertase YidC [Candidatus Saganbacteria bacterium]|nr:membrane protein insertase YidC [Candidatus Saganbacteria bacterium]